jgi:hypothetical protein
MVPALNSACTDQHLNNAVIGGGKIMIVKTWRFITLELTALLTGMTFCHVLEMPAKMRYSASLYLSLHRSLYVAFGPPNIGVFIEFGAILAVVVLVFMVHKERPAFWLTLAGAAALVLGLVVYFLFVEPANAAMKAMMIEAPADTFISWRNSWEYGHAAHFALHLLGFSALVLSVLVKRITLSAPDSNRAPQNLHEFSPPAGR